jgi:acyl-[acyl-carrier-protein]-phospholipid O-acyltransferase/long-chain-fatty-acid--[acyl-carrier-protein] ligase
MTRMLRYALRWLLTRLYRVEVKGIENYHQAGGRVLIVANHTSYLDAVLLAAFLPERLTFAINTHVARKWWLRLVLYLVDFFPLDPTNPLSVKSLIRYLEQERTVVIFPEGRITVTGSLMKIYQGSGLVADRSRAAVLPVRIAGAQYTPFSRLRRLVRLRWFPAITLTLLPARRLRVDEGLKGRARRQQAGRALADLMTEMIFTTTHTHKTLFTALLDARRVHGGAHVISEDIQFKPLTYNQLITRTFVLGAIFARQTHTGEHVGVLLPSVVNTLVVFFALQLRGRVPAMMNFTAGAAAMIGAAETARIRLLYTSRQFVETAKLVDVLHQLERHLTVVYLEDLRDAITPMDKLRGLVAGRFAAAAYRRLCPDARPDGAAVILFTSGTESSPKGVVLSHANLLANQAQIASRMDFHAQDIILNALPLFHSFGLTAGTLLPLISGMKVFLYPSPLHYRIVPEIAYDINATVFFGTNTFLAGYARFAHPYDFYSTRYVFAGAEKLQEETRRVWWEKFGIRVFEGYGTTETSPVLAVNTPMEYQAGSVGRLLPGIEHYLEAVKGIDAGGRLCVRGPNVMLGYLTASRPGEITPPVATRGAGWYDTGDIVDIDAAGFVRIVGRAKRFAKVGGEMVSLAAAEDLVGTVWPGSRHAVINVPDPRKGEQLILLTERQDVPRQALMAHAREQGISELLVPSQIVQVKAVPLLGTGKVDYPAARVLVTAALEHPDRAGVDGA